MIIELKSYNLHVAELLIIAKCIEDHPDMNAEGISELLGISKSNFYLKVKMFRDTNFYDLINLGCTVSFLIKIQQL